VNLGPTIAALEAEVSLIEAEVSTVVDNVLSESVPLVGSVGCVPYDVTSILSGGRFYPC
jgi:hypothetical protein